CGAGDEVNLPLESRHAAALSALRFARLPKHRSPTWKLGAVRGNSQKPADSDEGARLGRRSSRGVGPALAFSCTIEMYWSMPYSSVLPLRMTSAPVTRANSATPGIFDNCGT